MCYMHMIRLFCWRPWCVHVSRPNMVLSNHECVICTWYVFSAGGLDVSMSADLIWCYQTTVVLSNCISRTVSVGLNLELYLSNCFSRSVRNNSSKVIHRQCFREWLFNYVGNSVGWPRVRSPRTETELWWTLDHNHTKTRHTRKRKLKR
jgi:hypothetical protein